MDGTGVPLLLGNGSMLMEANFSDLLKEVVANLPQDCSNEERLFRVWKVLQGRVVGSPVDHAFSLFAHFWA